MKEVKIGKRIISNYDEPYVIAEIGANHNGDIELAKEMIKEAVKCGADAVKFQSWTPDSLIAKEEYERNQSYEDGDGGKKHFGSLREMVTKYYLNEKEHSELKLFCDKLNVDFCSTPFSKSEVDMLVKLGVPFIKVASMDINNLPLLKYIAKQKLPVILSSGMASIAEIDKAVKVIESENNYEIIILHCISIYPPEDKDIHLNNIKMLQAAFDYPIGFSDHSIGVEVPIAAVALGACLIEKHFTLDKDMPGWDHAVSANPEELRLITQGGKKVSKALGSLSRIVSFAEENKKEKFRRSIVTSRDLNKGIVLTEDDIDYKRPGTGIAPDKYEYVIGRKLNRNIAVDEIIKWEDFE